MTALYDIYQLYAAELTFTAVTIAAIVLVWNIVLTLRLRTMQARYHAAIGGQDGLDIETQLGEVHTRSHENSEHLHNIEETLQALTDTLAGRAGRVGVVRYNPFAETGGDQSFALAIVNDAGTGVVISSLHNRDATRVYAKPLTNGESKYQLTDEELDAIQHALNN